MSTPYDFEKTAVSWEKRHIAGFLAGMATLAAAIFLNTAPLESLLGGSSAAMAAAMHGAFSFGLVGASVVGLYLGIQLLRGREVGLLDLRIVASFLLVFSLATIVYGNWIYIAYRANVPDSPRTYFMATAPAIHKIFFEFKEFTALFTLPLSGALAALAFERNGRVTRHRWLRYSAATLLILVFFYASLAFGLGAAVTKLKSV